MYVQCREFTISVHACMHLMSAAKRILPELLSSIVQMHNHLSSRLDFASRHCVHLRCLH